MNKNYIFIFLVGLVLISGCVSSDSSARSGNDQYGDLNEPQPVPLDRNQQNFTFFRTYNFYLYDNLYGFDNKDIMNVFGKYPDHVNVNHLTNYFTENPVADFSAGRCKVHYEIGRHAWLGFDVYSLVFVRLTDEHSEFGNYTQLYELRYDFAFDTVIISAKDGYGKDVSFTTERSTSKVGLVNGMCRLTVEGLDY